MFLAGLALGQDVRLSNDQGAAGYVSAYTIATGQPYTDAVLSECSMARGRQNEPAVAVDPRNTSVLIGSSNDYCGVYAGSTAANFMAIGPIWLGYYRSENGGASFTSSLVPGYPGDTSPYAALARIRTASSGDPVIAWDSHGRVFMGSESSDDPAGSKKTFGDVWVATFDNPNGANGATVNDGKRFVGSVIVAKGSSAPNLLGKFHDKTAIEADRTGGACDGNVYFAWARFAGAAGDVSIYLARSTDHGATWSQPAKLTPSVAGVQDPDISVAGNGHVYVTYREFSSANGQPDAVGYVKSTDCGKTFGPPKVAATFIPYEPEDRLLSGGSAGDCGDFASACQSGFTFFRSGTTPRSTADQYEASEFVYIVYEASKPGSIQRTGNTFGTVGSGVGSQAGTYFVRLNGAAGTATQPLLIDDQQLGHQVFPDVSADGGILHVIWWDSRYDSSYSPIRPIGNTASGMVHDALDVFGTRSPDQGTTWAPPARVSSRSTNPNYEQFSDRVVPFAGDYLWVTSLGAFAYVAWTDWRDTVKGVDPREPAAENDGADVLQCRNPLPGGGFSGDQCPRAGGLDQNIYANFAP